MIRNRFLVIFPFLIFKFALKQGNSESKVNLLNFTYQNLVELKRFKNRLIEQCS